MVENRFQEQTESSHSSVSYKRIQISYFFRFKLKLKGFKTFITGGGGGWGYRYKAQNGDRAVLDSGTALLPRISPCLEQLSVQVSILWFVSLIASFKEI